MSTYSVIVVNPLEKCSGDDKPAGMLFQYDYGQKIAIGGVTLPAAYEVHFSNQKLGKSVTVIGDVTGIVDIPDALLLTGQDVHVWLYLHQGEDDGETVYYARIAVKGRAKPTHETPTPVQQDEITQAIAALNAAVEATEADAAAAEASAEDAGRSQAAAEAAQDRAEAAQGAAESAQTGAETAQDKAEDAQEAAEGARDRAETAAAFLEDCSAEAETLTAGSDATASYSEGVFHFGIPRGQKGSKGDPGDRGPEGPTGPEGPEGPAGYSPTASVSKSGSTATISITDKTGTTTATVSDGAPGQDGYTPVRGTDYWTAADQAAIVADVEADLIDDTAGAGDTTKVWSADKSSSELSGVLSEIDSKAPVILRDASGDIVTFADGADNMPLSSCVVSIDPVQSGSGDPSPTNVRPITGHTGANIYRSGADTSDPTVYAVDWQTAAGTVYGGTINLVSQTLIVTHGRVNLGSLEWTALTCRNETSTGRHYMRATLSGCKMPSSNAEIADIISEQYAATNYNTVYGGNVDFQIALSSSNHRICVYNSNFNSSDSASAFTTAMSGVYAVFALETPLVYSLSDLPTITTLSGYNAIWADTGAVAVTYPADTRTYVDSAIQTATDPDGNVITVTGSTPSITGVSGKRYVCGTVDSISITPPQTGIIDVVFTSGTTPTVLTASGVTWPSGFNPNSLVASTAYEINVMNGLGAVMTWPI